MLKKGYSDKTLQENIKTELRYGKSPQQSVAIAESVKEKAMKEHNKSAMKSKK